MSGSPAIRDDLLEGGEQLCAQTIAALPDADFGSASLLPGWDRAHVVAHLAGNAVALTNLVNWAHTGVPTPMYADAGDRNRQIEQWAQLAPQDLRTEFATASEELLAAWHALPEESWTAEVKTFHGRPIPVSEICWMRARESHVHTVDLAAGVQFGDLELAFLDPFVDDVTSALSAKGAGPVRLVDPDRDHTWYIGTAQKDADVVTGSTDALARWVCGRGAEHVSTPSGQLPTLPAWL